MGDGDGVGVGVVAVPVAVVEFVAVAVVLVVVVGAVGLVGEVVVVLVEEGGVEVAVGVAVSVGVAVGVEQPPLSETVSLEDATVAPETWSISDALSDASQASAERTCILIVERNVPPVYIVMVQVSLPK